MNKTIYVAGRCFRKDNDQYQFQLMKPSTGSLPYYTGNPDSRAMRLLEDNGSTLYRVDFENGILVNVNDHRYSYFNPSDLDYQDRCPKRVEDPSLITLIREAVKEEKTKLSY